MTDSVCTTNPAVNQEVWKEVPGYPGYQVSDFGNVKSFKHTNPKILKPGVWNNRKSVVLSHKNGKTNNMVYRLVLSAFVGECPEGMEACHYDGNSMNDRLDNLRWDTPQNNCRDKNRHGTNLIGERNRNSKIKDADIVSIRQKFYDGCIISEIAADYQVNPSCIYKIVVGESHQHLGGYIHKPKDYSTRHRNPSNYGEKCHFSKINNSDVYEILRLIKTGYPLSKIADQFGIAKKTVVRIRDKKAWKKIQSQAPKILSSIESSPPLPV